MPIDFKKLLDPAYQEQRRVEREAEQQRAEEHDKKLRGWLRLADEHYEELSQKERSFISSCRFRLNTGSLLTEPQEKWLKDIARRFGADDAGTLEVVVGRAYTHTPTGKQVRVLAKANTLDAEKWHVEQVGGNADGKPMFPVHASSLAPLA
jgi:hypothetical protein